MAEASMDNHGNRFYCYECQQLIKPILPDFNCPVCKSGFIEELDQQSDPMDITGESREDSENDHSTDGSHLSDLLENLYDQFVPVSHQGHTTNGSSNVSQEGTEASRGTPSSTSPSSNADQDGLEGAESGAGRGRARRRGPNPRRPHPRGDGRYYQFQILSNTSYPQHTLEGIFQQILSNVAGGQVNQLGGQPGEPANRASGIVQQILSNVTGGQVNTTDPASGQGRGRGRGFINFDFPMPLFQVLHGNPGDYAWGSGGLDAVITQLLNQLECTGPPPMPTEQITAIPSVNITEDDVNKNLRCSVCMEDFKIEEAVKKLACTHVYHNDCIVPWLELHGTCPICRKLLNENTSSQTGCSNNPNSTTQASSNVSSNSSNRSSSSASSYYEFLDDYD